MTDTPKREPLLSDDAITQWSSINMTGVAQRKAQPPHTNTSYSHGAKHARDHYENLIDTGVLMVVKTAGIDADGNCTECGWDADHRYPFSTCCPGCGLRIVE